MTTLDQRPLAVDEARRLVDTIKTDVESIGDRIATAYLGRAWEALLQTPRLCSELEPDTCRPHLCGGHEPQSQSQGSRNVGMHEQNVERS